MQASDAFTTSTYYNRRAPHWGSRHVVARNPSPALQVSDLHAMEGLVLQTLDFRLNSPTAHTFLSIFSQGVGLHGRAAALASMYTVSRHLQCSSKAALPGLDVCSEGCKPLGAAVRTSSHGDRLLRCLSGSTGWNKTPKHGGRTAGVGVLRSPCVCRESAPALPQELRKKMTGLQVQAAMQMGVDWGA